MNFDRVAKPYQFLERLAFGRALERCRTSLLPKLTYPARALLVGEGDGRFLQQFLASFPDVKVDVVEPSRVMIGQAQRRVGRQSNVRFHREGILTADLAGPYDLVVTHFVLDVFTPLEVEALAQIVRGVAPPRQMADLRIPRVRHFPVGARRFASVHRRYVRVLQICRRVKGRKSA